MAIGGACVAMGLSFVVLGIFAVIDSAGSIGSEGYAMVPMGLIWAFGGALLALPPGNSRWRDSACSAVTSFAVLCDWVAFAPGERVFTGGFSHGSIGGRSHVSGFWGRVVFGAAAIVLNWGAVILWIRQFKKVAKT